MTSATTTPTPTTSTKDTPLPPSASALKQGLTCTHVEHLVSCDLQKLDTEEGGYSLKTFHCLDPSSPSCFSSPGTYICGSDSNCRRVLNPDRFCTRICHNIGFDGKNVVIADQQYAHVLTAKCSKAYRGWGKKRVEVWPRGVNHLNDEKWKLTPPILLTCNEMLGLDQLRKGKGDVNVNSSIKKG